MELKALPGAAYGIWPEKKKKPMLPLTWLTLFFFVPSLQFLLPARKKKNISYQSILKYSENWTKN